MKLLHVDDDPDIRDIARFSLELDREFVVESAGSARDALSMLGASQPDVILLDVMMPDMDGPEMFRSLQGDPATAEIPVIFMTAAVQEKMSKDLMEIGASGIIGKPFDPMSLAGKVRALIERRR